MFTRDDAIWLSDIVNAFYVAQTPAQLALAAIALAHGRFRSVATACEEVTSVGSRYVMQGVRCETPIPPDYAACIHDNPTFQLLCSGNAPAVMQLTKLISREAYERTDHFNGLGRVVGFRDELQCTATSPSVFFSFGLFRDAAFTSREFELMRLVQPHLHAAWHRVRTAGEDLPGSLQIELSTALRPRQISPTQRAVLRAYFPAWRDASSLPLALRNWLTRSLHTLLTPTSGHPLQAFVIDSARGRLFARCFPSADGASVHLVLLERPAEPDFFRLRKIGLTSRECEVLHWIAQGKRDAEIAIILGCAAATVSKHVENVLKKFHAGNRAAAVASARNLL